MRSVRSTIAVTAAALVLSGAAAGTAHAAPAPTALPLASGSSAGVTAPASATGALRFAPPSALVLTIGKGTEPMTAAVQRAVTLGCEPRATGTHPSPRAACRELRAVDGDFAALPSVLPAVSCTREYDPVTVTAQGVWRGRMTDWSATYNNGCEMRATLGGGVLYSF